MGRENQKADVVIVGGGTAGCVLAARLSEDPARTVVLIEAGPAEGPAEVHIVPAWPALLGGQADWSFLTAPQRGLGGKPVFFPRGKMLGGSSAINAMAHIRGHRRDYDAWQESGATGWGYDDLLPFFKRSETAPHGDPAYRGAEGPMQVGPAATKHPVAEAGIAAAAALGQPVSNDLNGAEQEGAGWLEINAVDGVRQTAFDAYLAPVLDRVNLTVVTGAVVRSLIVRDGVCTGVVYGTGAGETELAAPQVVLAAGAIASPQLLMLSGIGPADDLRALGIEVKVDAPQVGKNLQDHPLAAVVYAASDDMPPGTNNHADAAGLLRTRPRLAQPDVMTLFLDVPFHPPTLVGPPVGFSIGFALLKPESRGSVTLASADPGDAPVIDPDLLGEEADMVGMVAALRLARRIAETSEFDGLRGAEVLPGPSASTDEQLRDFLRADTGTYFHPVGTCRLGSDPASVVDLDLRVRGVSGLMVADASVMPTIVSANTNATVLAIAEKAAGLLVAAS